MGEGEGFRRRNCSHNVDYPNKATKAEMLYEMMHSTHEGLGSPACT